MLRNQVSRRPPLETGGNFGPDTSHINLWIGHPPWNLIFITRRVRSVVVL